VTVGAVLGEECGVHVEEVQSAALIGVQPDIGVIVGVAAQVGVGVAVGVGD
jgi:hypothetical protein